MDMVRYIDGLGASVLTGIERPEIARWEAEIAPKAARLTQPRYLLLGLPEFATAAALDHYQMRKRRTLGDLVELRAEIRRYVAEPTPDLEALDRMIESPRAVNGTLSLDDSVCCRSCGHSGSSKDCGFLQRVRVTISTR